MFFVLCVALKELVGLVDAALPSLFIFGSSALHTLDVCIVRMTVAVRHVCGVSCSHIRGSIDR